MSAVLDLPRSAALASRLIVVPQTGSTNADLVARAAETPADWPHLSVIVTDHQTAGRGRLGRSWQAPPGTSLAISVLLRPGLPTSSLGWLPLLAGEAMARAVRGAGAAAALKWPNDVLIGGRKVSGILAELLPDASGVVVGAGLNLTIAAADLPVPAATSLLLEGVAQPDSDALLADYLTGLAGLCDALVAAGGDADAAGLRTLLEDGCDTVGRTVRVELPGGGTTEGRATGLDPDGRLVVETSEGRTAVAAGDVTHLRY